jgi:hypothetical protein
MTEENSSLGIHDHPAKKLGKKPPANRRTVRINNYLKLTEVPHPDIDVPPVFNFPMDRNDQAGDCVVAGLDHTLQTIAGQLGVPRQNWTDAQILAHYQTQNPDFHSWDDSGTDADQGMVVQTFLEYLVAQKEIVAFGTVDVNDPEALRAATYVGLAIVTGEDLRAAQQRQLVWDYVSGSPDWGGHCTCTIGYTPSGQTGVSWGMVQPMTDSFVANQVDEAWLIITKEMISHASFRNKFDLPGFSSAISSLTKGKVVIPLPTVPPTPAPVPPMAVDFPMAKVKPWLAHTHNYTRVEQDAKAAIKAWAAAHGL